MIRSQLNSYSGNDPIWGFVALVGAERFTGEAAVGLDPRIRLFAMDGRVYYAEREGDAPVGTRLVHCGAVSPAQLEHGAVSIGEVQSLARLFQREPLIDRDAVELTIEHATESLLESVANKPVGMPEVFPLRHHPAGIHHWLRSAAAVPAPVPTAAEVVVESVVEPVVEPAATPVVEWAPEPVIESVIEPVIEPVAEPVVAWTPEPVVEAVVESEPVVEPVVEPAPAASFTALSLTPLSPPAPEPVVEEVVVEEVAPEPEPAPTPTFEPLPMLGLSPLVVETPAPVSEAPVVAEPVVEMPVVEVPVVEVPVVEESPIARLAPLPLVATVPEAPAAPAPAPEPVPELHELEPLTSLAFLSSMGTPEATPEPMPQLSELPHLAAPAPHAPGHLAVPPPSAPPAEMPEMGVPLANLPKLANGPISVGDMNTTAHDPARAAGGATHNLAAVEIWELVDELMDGSPAAQSSAPADESEHTRGRGWLRGKKS